MINKPNFTTSPKTSIRKILTREVKINKHFHEFAEPFVKNKGTVLLLSGGEQEHARYNILATEPWLEISSKGTNLFITEQGRTTELSGNPFDLLQGIKSNCQQMYENQNSRKGDSPDLPISAGLFGYLSYDMKDHIEFISRTTIDDLNLPDLYMIAPQLLVIEDRVTGRIYAQIVELEGDGSKNVDQLLSLLTAAESPSIQGNFTISREGFESNFKRDEYENYISEIIDYIKEGDIYQVNMSQRFTSGFSGNPYVLFTELFKENPAAFFSYLNCGDHTIVSTSPERFIFQDKKRIEAKPIKGTRPRGKTVEEDDILKAELQASPKDDAELSMIVDLLRNDMGKVCKGGSIRVLNHKSPETYKNVFHLVSTIEGILEDGKDSIDLLKACFPGGSITGCPKIRSMEIIDEKEPFRRHIYTGAIGYIGFNNRMDFSIVIRTATITGGKVLFSVGGGIVYDSDPADEFDETLHKAQSLMKVMNRHIDKARNLPGQTGNTPELFQKQLYCWNDGKFILEKDAVIPGMSKGYQYGKGIFETLKIEKGKVEYLEEHLGRLKKGSRIVLGEELTELDWVGIAELLIKRNGLQDSTAVMKIMISEGKSGLFYNQNITVTCKRYETRKPISKTEGFTLVIYTRKRENFLADYKTMNYLFYLKAGEWAKENGFDEAVILNADGSVSETNTGNILLLRDKCIIVPESKHRLPGVMERKILGDYKHKGFKIVKEKIDPQKLFKTQTILVTNSLIGAVESNISSSLGYFDTRLRRFQRSNL
jgi:para-aminobenzoate synthetase component 1